MSIIELGALGEFLGSIGVIATLIYLAIQIRQNTHSLSGFNALVRNLAPQWEALDDWRQARRPSFRAEVERILSESEAESEENAQ